MCAPDLTCLASTVSKILKGVRKLECKSRDSGHAPLGVNSNFLINTDLINNCTKLDVCSFSQCENTARKPVNVQFEENVKYCCQATPPPPLKRFLYSCCCLVWTLSAHAMVTTRSRLAAVSEFVEARSV